MPEQAENEFAVTTRHVVEGRGIVGRQLARIAKLKARGFSTEDEEKMLRVLESALRVMEQHLQRIRKRVLSRGQRKSRAA
jgi:hypothetical protein